MREDDPAQCDPSQPYAKVVRLGEVEDASETADLSLVDALVMATDEDNKLLPAAATDETVVPPYRASAGGGAIAEQRSSRWLRFELISQSADGLFALESMASSDNSHPSSSASTVDGLDAYSFGNGRGPNGLAPTEAEQHVARLRVSDWHRNIAQLVPVCSSGGSPFSTCAGTILGGPGL